MIRSIVSNPDPPPVPHATLGWISASSIKNYLTCSLRYFFEKVLRLSKPSSPNLHIGKAVHEGVRRYHLALWRGEDSSKEAIVASYHTSFQKLEEEEEVQFKDEGHRSDCLATGERVLQAYLESEAAQFSEKPAGVEVHLEEQLPEFEAPLVGIIDLVRQGNIPVDFKTVGSTPGDLELESFLHEIQLTLYAILLEEATGSPVTAMELIFLVKTKTPKVIRHTLPPPSIAQKERFLSMANAFTEGVLQQRFYPQPGQHCSWCSYRNECRQWTGT